MRDKLLLATSNHGKVTEFTQLLQGVDLKLVSLAELGICDTVDETGTTFLENAILKATTYSTLTGMLTLSDDSGLEVDVLNGRPGIRSARYGSAELSDEQRVELILQELNDIPWKGRTARFRCVIAIAGLSGRTYTVEGVLEGVIQCQPEGSNGFGYDPIFYVPEKGCTTAQLSATEKNVISHRGKAARKAAALFEAGILDLI